MIRLGPAGTGMDILEGLGFVKSLGLEALEVPFTHGVRMTRQKAIIAGRLNRRLGLSLSVHAPYYINLASLQPEKVAASEQRIIDSCERAHLLGAESVVLHPGYIMQRQGKDVFCQIRESIFRMQDILRSERWKVSLAPETAGKISQWGSLSELLLLREETGCSLCIDFAHLYARNLGRIDWGSVFDEIKGLGKIHSHCSGIVFGKNGEIRHERLDRAFFLPIARQIVSGGLDITIISESPDPWKDSLKMKNILREAGAGF